MPYTIHFKNEPHPVTIHVGDELVLRDTSDRTKVMVFELKEVRAGGYLGKSVEIVFGGGDDAGGSADA